MKKEKRESWYFEADEGMMLVSAKIKSVKKAVLSFSEDHLKRFGYKEVTAEESVKIQERWDREKYEYFKLLYGNGDNFFYKKM
jgi:hypothetical protein